MFADDIHLFVSGCLDIKAVKKAVARYEQIVRAKINFDKTKSLQLGAWRGGVPLPGPFRWSDGLVRIQLEWNWLEVQSKVDAQVGTWLQRRLSLKGRAEVYAIYTFPLILYHLSVLPLPKNRWLALQRSISKLLWGGWGWWFIDRSVVSINVMEV